MDEDNEELAAVLQRHQRKVLDAVALLETRLGVSQGVFQSLRDDQNSWSFLVRIVVFIQAAMAHAVAHKLGRPELESYFAEMHLGARHGGLLQLAEKVQVIDSRDIAFVEALGLVRNRFAHKLANINRHLAVFFADLPKKDFETLMRKLVPGLHPEKWPKDRNTLPMLTTLAGMDAVIWWGAVGLCAKLSTSAVDAEWQHAKRVLREAEDEARIGLLGAGEDSAPDSFSATGHVGS